MSASIADELAFAALPLETRELVGRLLAAECFDALDYELPEPDHDGCQSDHDRDVPQAYELGFEAGARMVRAEMARAIVRGHSDIALPEPLGNEAWRATDAAGLLS